MGKQLVSTDILFEITDVFGRKIRTTRRYWKKIKEIKHTELRFGISEVKKTLTRPQEVRRSVTDPTILLFAKKVEKHDILIAAIKILNGNGFLVTCYQTKTHRKKGELIWPTQQKNK